MDNIESWWFRPGVQRHRAWPAACRSTPSTLLLCDARLRKRKPGGSSGTTRHGLEGGVVRSDDYRVSLTDPYSVAAI